MKKFFIFQCFYLRRDIIQLTLWCCIVRGSVLFLFSVDAPGERSKRPPQPKTPALQVLQLPQGLCVFALCTGTRVYVLVRLLTFQLILFSPPLFLLLTLSPGHRLINGYHSQLISYSSFGNYIRILTTQTKR